jgi:hypothetical protein
MIALCLPDGGVFREQRGNNVAEPRQTSAAQVKPARRAF